MTKVSALISIFLVLTASMILASPEEIAQSTPSAGQLENEIRKALLLAPHYGVFDALFFKLEGNDVTLLGQVMLPITKDEAGRRVAKIAGIGKITNNIEVLPLSRNDDFIRLRVYRRLFGTADLYRYALGANPSIHIIVKGGHLTLEGVVSTEGDKTIANIAAREVPGIFSVTNNLRVEK